MKFFRKLFDFFKRNKPRPPLRTDREKVEEAIDVSLFPLFWDWLQPGEAFKLEVPSGKECVVEEIDCKTIPLNQLLSALYEHSFRLADSYGQVACAGFTTHEMNTCLVPEGHVFVRLGRLKRSVVK